MTEIWTLEKDLCRCCLAEGDFKNLALPCSDIDENTTYVDMIRDCLDINMVPVPGLLCAVTYTICEACITKLIDATKFKATVDASEKKFKDMYNRNVIIKKEPCIEVAVKEELPEDDTCQEDDFSPEEDNDDNFEELPDYAIDEEENKTEPDEAVKKKIKKVPLKSKKVKANKKVGRPKKLKEEPIRDDEVTKKKEHVRVDDYVTEVETTDKKYICRACDIAYKRVSDLRYHINRTHLKEKFVKCNLCPESFMYHSQRKQHLLKEHLKEELKKFSCANCNRQFNRKNSLAAHMMDVHIEKKCAHCHLKFPRKKYLFHMNEAHDVPMPTCGICGLRTLIQSALIRHQRHVHLNEKKKLCLICEKRFNTQSNLRDHMITHEQKRDFKCDICLKDFARKESYKAHYRIHTGERPFRCEVCEASFVQRGSLKFHFKSRHQGAKTTAEAEFA